METLLERHRRLCGPEPLGPADRVLLLLLLPFGLLYGLIGLVRRRLYRAGWLRRFRAAVPVVSVGNLSAGGTGKTPMVDHVVRRLQAKGLKVAVVSRGYGGTAHGMETVCRGDGPLVAPAVCGDEPYLLARRNPTAVVLVAPRRAVAVRQAGQRHGADVVVLDDGFQHLAVERDLDIVLLDARRPFGNGHPLPAGSLREFPSALGDADLLVFTRCDSAAQTGTGAAQEIPSVRCRHRLSDRVRSLRGEEISLAELAGKKGVAFAGIADPTRFFKALEVCGLYLSETIALPDHADFGQETLARLGRAGREADFLVTTEKDGVKLKARDFAVPCYVAPMELEFEDAGPLYRALDNLFP